MNLLTIEIDHKVSTLPVGKTNCMGKTGHGSFKIYLPIKLMSTPKSWGIMTYMHTIRVTYQDKDMEVVYGTTIREALSLFGLEGEMTSSYQDNPIVAALVNSTPRNLESPLQYRAHLVPIRLFSDMGKVCYRQSLCYLLAAASEKVLPERKLEIGYALGDGYYFTFCDNLIVSSETVHMLEDAMRSLIEKNLPIRPEVLSLEEAIEYFSLHHGDETVSLLQSLNFPSIEVYTMGDHHDVVHAIPLPRSGLITVWELRQYKQRGLLLRYPRSFDYTRLDTYKENPLLYEALKKDKQQRPLLKVNSIGDLAKIVDEQKIVPYIRLCEESQARHISEIAESICRKKSKRIIFICGPSSSGKTTFSYKLCTQLEVRGHKTIQLSLDNYYLTPDKCPRSADGKPDLEVLEALNLPLLQQNLSALAEGKSVRLPTYSFASRVTTFGEPISLDETTYLVVEGIHAMNPRISRLIDPELIYRVYISAFTQVNITDHNRISTTDNRIIRRIVRDRRTRASSAEDTLRMMKNVCRGENLYIFPFQNNADVMINSALDYELAVLAPLAVPLLRKVAPNTGEIYVTARRLLKFLTYFQPVSDTLVPQDSLLREFIGGSEFNVT